MKKLRSLGSLLVMIVMFFALNIDSKAEDSTIVDAVGIEVLEGAILEEGQILTAEILDEAINVNVLFQDGKAGIDYKSYTCSQIGKTIKPIKRGKHKGTFKIVVKAGKKKKAAYISVDKIVNIDVKTTLKLVNGQKFSTTAFAEKTSVIATYESGKKLPITTYKINVADGKKVSAKDGKFAVKVKYGNLSQVVEIPVTGKPYLEYQVSITSNVEGVTLLLDGIQETEKVVVDGTQCNVSAIDNDTYKFTKWVNSDNVEVSTSSTYSFIVTADTSLCAIYEKKSGEDPKKFNLSIEKIGQGTVRFDGTEVNESKTSLEVTEGEHRLSAQPADEYYFVNYQSENKVVSSSQDYTFTVNQDTSIVCYFEKYVNVNFVEQKSDGEVEKVFSEYKLKRTESTLFQIPTEDLYRSEKTFSGWILNGVTYAGAIGASDYTSAQGKSLKEAIRTSIVIGSDCQVIAYYTVENTQFTVTVNGGTIEADGYEVTSNEGTSTVTVPKGTVISIKASIPESKFFVEWQNADDDSLRTKAQDFNITVNSNMNLKAIYEDQEPEEEMLVYFRTVDGASFKRNDPHISYYVGSDIPTGYKKVEWGVFSSYTATDDTQMVLDNANLIKKYKDPETSASFKAQHASWTLTLEYGNEYYTEARFLRLRAYAIVEDPQGVQHIIYSPTILHVQF